MARRTISGTGSLEGVGLHTGATTTLQCHPAPSETGIVFRRTDLPGEPEVAARISEVEVTDRHTAIGHGDQTIHTVEHLLAAVAAHHLDDVVLELHGPEPPILDGSFRPFFDLLADAGPVEHDGDPVVYKITAPLQITEGDSTYVVAPADELRLTASIDFPHGLIGRQVGSYAATTEVFATELADSRTFGFDRLQRRSPQTDPFVPYFTLGPPVPNTPECRVCSARRLARTHHPTARRRPPP